MTALAEKKILVLGGTAFIGRVITEALLKEGVSPVLCNRGVSAPDVFSDLELIKLDREKEDPAILFSREWDAVIDVSSYYPNTLADLASGFKGKVGRYIYISTASVYRFASEKPPLHEEMEKVAYSTADRTDETMATYGQRKAACEDELLQSDLDALIFRPSVVYGRFDPYDRHLYWINRAQHGGQVLLPALDGLHSYTYVEDLASLVVAAVSIEQHQQVYNAATHAPLTLAQMVEVCGGDKADFSLVRPSLDEFRKIAGDQAGKLPLLFGGLELQQSLDRVLADFGNRVEFSDFKTGISKTAEWYRETGWKEGDRWLSLEAQEELIAQFT